MSEKQIKRFRKHCEELSPPNYNRAIKLFKKIRGATWLRHNIPEEAVDKTRGMSARSLKDISVMYSTWCKKKYKTTRGRSGRLAIYFIPKKKVLWEL